MTDFFKLSINLVKPYFKKQILGIFLVFASSIMALILPIISKYLIDQVLPAKSYEKLFIGLSIFIGCSLLEVAFGVFNQLFFMFFFNRLNINLKNKMMEKIINAPLKFHGKSTVGEITNRFYDDTDFAVNHISGFYIDIFKNLVWVVVIFGILLFLAPLLTIVIILFSIIVYMIFKILSKKIESYVHTLRSNGDKVMTVITQITGSIYDIKSNSLEGIVLKDWKQLLNKCLSDNIKYGKLSVFINNINVFLSVMCTCIIYGYGAIGIMKDTMSLGGVISYGIYFQMLIGPIYAIIGIPVQISNGKPSMKRFLEYMNLDQEDELLKSPYPLKGDICLDGIEFSYEEGKKVLNGVTMYIPEKGFTAVVGSSGAGKSTLLKVLTGYYAADKGKYMFGCTDVSKIPSKNLRQNIALVSQDTRLFNVSILENLMYGDPNANMNEVIEVCKRVRMHDQIMQLPNQYETIVSEKIELSGGEKQRLIIARALLKKPPLMVFDEPTSALDPENEANIASLLCDISKDFSVVVVSHRLSTIIGAGNIYFLDDGKIVEYGSHDELVRKNGMYYQSFILGQNSNDKKVI